MLTTISTLALALGLLASPGAAPAPGYPLNTSGTSRDFDRPPPGTPADQSLWQAAYDADNALIVEQHAAAKLAVQAKTNSERLRNPASRGTLAEARAEELEKPLAAKWAANVELMGSVWPVSKERGCRYELLNVEGVMLGTGSPRKERQLEDARRDLNACLEKATAILRALRRANEELRAANAEAERALGPPPAPPKATAASPAPVPAKR